MSIAIHKYSGIYCLQTAQHIAASLDEVWAFFSSPQNLQSITPDDIHFAITSGGAGPCYEGKIITYALKIFPLITTHWITEITVVQDKKLFVDEQRSGPYRLWHHEHHFEATATGVLMTDKVYYQLPLGWCGRCVAGGLVKQKLKKIFMFRRCTIDGVFNTATPQ